jgi:hypothetical protein
VTPQTKGIKADQEFDLRTLPSTATECFYCDMWLLKVSMQNESGPEGYLHFCEQDLTWSFYSELLTYRGIPHKVEGDQQLLPYTGISH